MMIDEIRFSARYTSGVTIACPIGTLNMSTYATFRDTLLKYGAEEPEALIVELDELDMPSTHALTVFSLAAMRMSDWPGIRLLLVARSEGRRSMLAASSIARFVPVHRSVDTAMAALAEPPARTRAVIELPPTSTSTRRARYFARMNCGRWQISELITDAMTVVTSLVENTLLHTTSTAFLRMELRRDLLTIAVSDDDPAPAVLRERAEGGVAPSGLLLVSAIATVWGCTPTLTGGKTVWAVLRPHGRVTSVRWQTDE
jgi:hypothetical protein